MNRRHDFVLQANTPGANMSALCRAFGISRKTGYKWLQRYRERGVRGLEDRTSGPQPGRSPLRTSAEIAIEIIKLRQLPATWGSRKLHAVLQREWPPDQVPSRRTVERVLREAGLVTPRRLRKRKYPGPGAAPDVIVAEPNDLWTVDFKGWWRARNGRKVEPLTVRDQFSRYVLGIELVAGTTTAEVRSAFEALFIDHGPPRAIQSDNGPPFVAMRSPLGLTRLSTWWVSLGVRFVRGRVGCPQDNGAHERMHRDMSASCSDTRLGTARRSRRTATDGATSTTMCVLTRPSA